MGEPDGDESHLASLAAMVVKRGWCEILVLSLGAGGALWVTASERKRLASPAVRIKSSVGAGDAWWGASCSPSPGAARSASPSASGGLPAPPR
jgi:fructose-1-phosphate kinase PfkB-like protein